MSGRRLRCRIVSITNRQKLIDTNNKIFAVTLKHLLREYNIIIHLLLLFTSAFHLFINFLNASNEFS